MRPESRGDPKDGGTFTPARIVVLAAMIIGLAVAAVLMFRGGGSYDITAEFEDAGQLVKGNQVKVGGTAVGSVKKVDVTSDGHAIVKFSVNDDYAPLRRGTKAIVKQTSLSGIANRYIDLELGPQTRRRRSATAAGSARTRPRRPWRSTRSSTSSTDHTRSR